MLGISGQVSSKFSATVLGAGVWGDSGNEDIAIGGVVGTADDGYGGFFASSGSSNPTLGAGNSSTSAGTIVFQAGGNEGTSADADTCTIYGSGDLNCSGTVSSAVKAADTGRQVETFAMQSPEDWIEDFGTGTLQRGVALVKIDPVFAETVSDTADHHVFITPNGDSEGLYVINKSATDFEVRESKGGISSLTFDYRIVAKRRGYEAQRLTDVTDCITAMQAQRQQRAARMKTARASKPYVEARMVEPQPAVSGPAPRPQGQPGGASAPAVKPVPAKTRPETFAIRPN